MNETVTFYKGGKQCQLLKQVFRKEKENLFLQKRKVEEKRDQKKFTLIKCLKCVLKRCS